MSAYVTFSPLLPWPVVIALAVLTLLPCLLALVTRRRGGLLRLAGFALLVLILAGPRWTENSTQKLPDVALVLIDHSPSMDIGARHEMAARALAALRASAARTGTHLIVADIPPAESGGTQILPAIHQALANIQPDQLAGIVAITDGEIADAAGLPHDAPFSALLTASGEETDRELRLDNAPSFGLVGQSVPLRLAVYDHGADDAGAVVPVTVTEDGVPVATTSAVVGQPFSVSLPVRHAGPAVIVASAPPLAGAVSAINDQAAFTLTGIHKRLNVLLVSGSPNQGERAWRLLLKSDPAVQLVHFTILRLPGEPLDADPRDIALVPFPVRELFETDIGKFDLIILDQFNANDLLPAEYLANIAAYVQNGGALLAEVGPEFAGPASLAGSPLAPASARHPGRARHHDAGFCPRDHRARRARSRHRLVRPPAPRPVGAHGSRHAQSGQPGADDRRRTTCLCWCWAMPARGAPAYCYPTSSGSGPAAARMPGRHCLCCAAWCIGSCTNRRWRPRRSPPPSPMTG